MDRANTQNRETIAWRLEDAIQGAFLVGRPGASDAVFKLKPYSKMGGGMSGERPWEEGFTSVSLATLIRVNNRAPLLDVGVRLAIDAMRAVLVGMPHTLEALERVADEWVSCVSTEDERRLRATPRNWDSLEMRAKWPFEVKRPSLTLKISNVDGASPHVFSEATRLVKRTVDEWAFALLRDFPSGRFGESAFRERCTERMDDVVNLEGFAATLRTFLEDSGFDMDTHPLRAWRTFVPAAPNAVLTSRFGLDEFVSAEEYLTKAFAPNPPPFPATMDPTKATDAFNEALKPYPYARTVAAWWQLVAGSRNEALPANLQAHGASTKCSFPQFVKWRRPAATQAVVDHDLRAFIREWLPELEPRNPASTGDADADMDIASLDFAAAASVAASQVMVRILALEDEPMKSPNTLFGAMDSVTAFMWSATPFERWLARFNVDHIAFAVRAIASFVRAATDQELGDLVFGNWDFMQEMAPVLHAWFESGTPPVSNLDEAEVKRLGQNVDAIRKWIAPRALAWSGPPSIAIALPANLTLKKLDGNSPIESVLGYEGMEWDFVEARSQDSMPPPSRLVVIRNTEEYADYLTRPGSSEARDLFARTSTYAQLVARELHAREKADRFAQDEADYIARRGASRVPVVIATNASRSVAAAARARAERIAGETTFGLDRRDVRAFKAALTSKVPASWYDLVSRVGFWLRGGPASFDRTGECQAARAAHATFLDLCDRMWHPAVVRLKELRHIADCVEWTRRFSERELTERRRASERECGRAIRAFHLALARYFHDSRLSNPNQSRFFVGALQFECVLGFNARGEWALGPESDVPFPVCAVADTSVDAQARKQDLEQIMRDAGMPTLTPEERAMYGVSRLRRELIQRLSGDSSVASAAFEREGDLIALPVTGAAFDELDAHAPLAAGNLRIRRDQADLMLPRHGAGDAGVPAIALLDPSPTQEAVRTHIPGPHAPDESGASHFVRVAVDTERQLREQEDAAAAAAAEDDREPAVEHTRVSLVLRVGDPVVGVEQSSGAREEFVCEVPTGQDAHSWAATANEFLVQSGASVAAADVQDTRTRIADFMRSTLTMIMQADVEPVVDITREAVGGEEALARREEQQQHQDDVAPAVAREGGRKSKKVRRG